MATAQSGQALPDAFLSDIRLEFRKLKKQADDALAQVSEEARSVQIDGEANSIAILMKHVGGNLRSRWERFLEADGEKADRNRDGEFIVSEQDTPGKVNAQWEEGWRIVFASVDALTPSDLSREVIIRAEPWPVVRAILRSLTHTAAHVGQIVLLAKHLQGAQWHTLSIARGQSEQFNREMIARFKAGGAA